MGKPKPTPTSGEIIATLATESDRGCIMVGASWIESLLREIAEASMILSSQGNPHFNASACAKLREELFSWALQRASDRLKYCRALGVISPERSELIKKISDFRNRHSAHWSGHFTLKNPAADVQNDIGAIFDLFVKFNPVELDAYDEVAGLVRNESKTLRERFQVVIMTLVIELHYAKTYLILASEKSKVMNDAQSAILKQLKPEYAALFDR